MASSNVCWGIEIGAGAIKAVKLEREGDSVNVVDFAVVPHKKVLSTPDMNPDDATRVALGLFTSQVDLGGAGIAVSVPGHASFARFAKLPPVAPSKVGEVVKFEAVQQIPFPIEDVEWDYQTFVSPDSPDVEVGIFAITRERILEKLRLYHDANLVPDILTVGPVAAYNALAFDMAFTTSTQGTILLDVGTTSTDLIIAEAGRVWVRTFPIGGHQFTEALVEAFKLSYPKAEKLKREAEQSKHARHVFQAMRPVFADLAQDVQRSIGYYQSLHKDANITRLIGIGSTFQLPGLRKYLKQQIGIDVYRLEEFKRLNAADEDRKSEFDNLALNMCTAYGLALQGVGLTPINANLMPAPVIRTAMWAKKVKWFGMAAGVSLVAGLSMFIRPVMDQQAVAATTKPAVIDQTIRDLERAKKDAVEAISGIEADDRLTNMLVLAQSREIYKYLLTDLGLMFDHAASVGSTWRPDESGTSGPAFVLKSFDTDYLAPGVPGGTAPQAREEDEDDEGQVPTDPILELQRIRISLVVETTKPSPEEFLVDTLDKWIRDNAVRDDVPYTILVDAPMGFIWSSKTETVGGDEGEGLGDSGRRPRGRAGRRAMTQEEMRDMFAREERERPAGHGEGQLIGGAPSPQSTEQAPKGRSNESLVDLAPIEKPEPYAKGSKLATFTLEWIVGIEPKDANPENDQ